LIIHVDDFRRKLDFSQLDPADESSLYYDCYFDFLNVSAALAAALAGPRDGAVAILEGVMVLRAQLPAGTPLVVLSVSIEEARRRIIARDQAKGRTVAEINRRIDRRYFPAHFRYCAEFDPQRRADLVVDNEDWVHPRLSWVRDARLPPDITAALDRFLSRAEVPRGTTK
jgi:hypothetical protein